MLSPNRRIGVLLMWMAVVPLAAGGKKSVADPVGVIHRAVDASDIWSAGPVRLKMHIKFMQVKSGEIEADYEKTWISPKQWRSQFSSPQFSEVNVGGDGQIWLKADLPEKPLRVREFERALAALSQSLVGEGLKYDVRELDLQGKKGKTTCVNVDDVKHALVQDCVDPTTGVFLQIRDIPPDWAYTYSDYQSFEGKQFPRTIGVIEGITPVAIAHVVELDVAPTSETRAFDPPAGSDPYKACPEALGFPLGAKGGKLVKQVDLAAAYPNLFHAGDRPIIHFSTKIIGVIGRDGNLHNLVVSGGAKTPTDEALLKAIQDWHYEPFTVCGNPIEMPTSIWVNLN